MIITLLQETSLDVKNASVLFDRFEKEHESNSCKMTQADVKSWIIYKGVEINPKKSTKVY